jgi:hypothetical protein
VSVRREELPVLAVTLLAPVLAVGAILALPVPPPADHCPQCGQSLHPGTPHDAETAGARQPASAATDGD